MIGEQSLAQWEMISAIGAMRPAFLGESTVPFESLSSEVCIFMPLNFR